MHDKFTKSKINFYDSGTTARFILPLLQFFNEEIHVSANKSLSKRPIT